jgi:DNA-binding transcriptional regulator LsrR (DeoR family)
MGALEFRENSGDPNIIARDIANIYGGSHHWLPCPGIVENSEQHLQVSQLKNVSKTLEEIEKTNVFLMGVWPWMPQDDDVIKRLESEGYITEDKLRAATEGAVANINFNFFNVFGESLHPISHLSYEHELSKKHDFFLTGFEISKLSKVSRNPNVKVILVSGGDRATALAVKAVLRAELVTDLVTDHLTAYELLKD